MSVVYACQGEHTCTDDREYRFKVSYVAMPVIQCWNVIMLAKYGFSFLSVEESNTRIQTELNIFHKYRALSVHRIPRATTVTLASLENALSGHFSVLCVIPHEDGIDLRVRLHI